MMFEFDLFLTAKIYDGIKVAWITNVSSDILKITKIPVQIDSYDIWFGSQIGLVFEVSDYSDSI